MVNTRLLSVRLMAWIPMLFAAICSLLLVDALVLMALDNINFGTVLPLALGVMGLAWCKYRYQWQLYLSSRSKYLWAWRILLVVLTAWLISLVVFFVWVMKPAAPLSKSVNVIMVLGSGLHHNQPTPTLQARLDSALVQAARFSGANIVVTGGVGWHQTRSEAEVMAEYLIARGIEPSRLILEKHSTSTYENLVFSKALLPDLDPLFTRIMIVSSDFHLLRAYAIAKRLGLPVMGTIAAPTPLLIRYNARLREYFAFVKGWILNEF
jgi:uncharacterized SAM-binding protein YcdF (DUF218 family)